jgi:starch synthase
VNTVSPWYAQDLLEEPFGAALSGNGIELLGVSNGIEAEEFDPRQPERSGIPAAFDPGRGDLAGKAVCRRVLLERIASGVTGTAKVIGRLALDSAAPLLAYIGRLTEQKGTTSLVRAFNEASGDFAAVVLGTGEDRFEKELAGLATGPLQGRLALALGFEPDLAKLVYAAADLVLVPSAYEPCGLVDMQAQAMGTVPIVHAVGGLKKVENGVTGFSYDRDSELAGTMERALRFRTEQPERFEAIRCEGFRRAHHDCTWDRVFTQSYLPLYLELSRPIS